MMSQTLHKYSKKSFELAPLTVSEGLRNKAGTSQPKQKRPVGRPRKRTRIDESPDQASVPVPLRRPEDPVGDRVGEKEAVVTSQATPSCEQQSKFKLESKTK